MLLLRQLFQEALMTKAIVIFLLKYLGFVINLKRSVNNFDPENQSFGPDNPLITINIVTDLPEMRQDTSSVLKNVQDTNGKTSGTHKVDRPTARPVCSPKTQFRFLEHLQIQALKAPLLL